MAKHRVASALTLVVLLVIGCGSATTDEAALDTLDDNATVRVSSRQRIDVDIRSTGPIQLGRNTVVVTFPDHGRTELASVSALMPAHGHGSPAPKIERSGDEFVVRDLVLYMSGRWELRLGLRADARDDEAIVAVDVP